MSRKKTQNNTNIILNRISAHYHLEDDVAIAAFYGVNKSTVSSWRTRNKINSKLIKAKCNDEALCNWFMSGIELNTGQGNMQAAPAIHEIHPPFLVHPHSPSHNHVVIDEGELIKKTLNVLKSNTPFSSALKENIESFHYAVECVGKLEIANSRIDVLEEKMKSIEERLPKADE